MARSKDKKAIRATAARLRDGIRLLDKVLADAHEYIQRVERRRAKLVENLELLSQTPAPTESGTAAPDAPGGAEVTDGAQQGQEAQAT